jgi:hypothetical protein
MEEVSKFKIGDFVRVKGTPSKNDDGRLCVISGRISKITYVPHTNLRQPKVGFVVDITTDQETLNYFKSDNSGYNSGPDSLTFLEVDLELDLGKNREETLNNLGIDGDN